MPVLVLPNMHSVRSMEVAGPREGVCRSSVRSCRASPFRSGTLQIGFPYTPIPTLVLLLLLWVMRMSIASRCVRHCIGRPAGLHGYQQPPTDRPIAE